MMYSNALEYILRLKSTLRRTDNVFYTQTHIGDLENVATRTAVVGV